MRRPGRCGARALHFTPPWRPDVDPDRPPEIRPGSPRRHAARPPPHRDRTRPQSRSCAALRASVRSRARARGGGGMASRAARGPSAAARIGPGGRAREGGPAPRPPVDRRAGLTAVATPLLGSPRLNSPLNFLPAPLRSAPLRFLPPPLVASPHPPCTCPRLGPNLAEFGRSKLPRTRSKLVKFVRARPNLLDIVQIWSNSGKVGQHRPNVEESPPDGARLRPMLVDGDPNVAKIGPNRRNPGRGR